MLYYQNLYKDDPEAFFNWLYETYSQFVYKEAWKYYNNSFDVEDLVQEVWLRLCRKGDLLCTYSKSQLFAYIAVSVKNNAISLVRKQNKDIPLEFADYITYDEVEIINDLIDRQMRIEEFRKVWSLVPEHERELLERKYYLLETDEEIAKTMGINKNSIRMSLSRARKKALSVLSKKEMISHR